MSNTANGIITAAKAKELEAAGYVIVNKDRLHALERLYREMISGTLDGADEAVDAISELEADTDG